MGKGFLMCNEIHEWIDKNIPKGSIILELGSGKGTRRLVNNGYKVYSIEHDKKWLNKYGSTYIYAPIKDNWYDIESIKKEIPEHYDLLLIDGPPRKIDGKKVGRLGMVEHLNIFDENAVMLFDNFDRGRENKLIKQISKKINREFVPYKGKDHRGKSTWFAVFEKED